MANVLFTTYCNRNCSYCFAQSKIDQGKNRGDESRHLSMQGLEKVLQFYKSSLLYRFVILGGEPTLNPEFDRMVDRILREKELESVIIFSNGLMPEKVLKYLCAQNDPRVRVALNLNSEENHTPSQWRQVNKTMKALGRRIGLGVNIYRPGQNYDYLVEAIEAYNLSHHIRVGLTHPIAGFENAYAHEDDFGRIAKDLVAFAEKAYYHKIGFSFDCGFQFCMFTLDQHKDLLRLGINFRSTCDPIIDIGPDLSVWRCFPLLNDVAGHLDDFSTRRQIMLHFNKKYRSIQSLGNLMECPQCIYRQNNLCSGGCLARSLIAFQRQDAVAKTNETAKVT